MNALLASQRNTTLRICLLAATALGGFARSAWADVMVGAGDGSAGNPYVLSGSGDITSYVLNNQNVQLSGGGKFTITIPQTGTNVLAGPGTVDPYLLKPTNNGYSATNNPTINYTGIISGTGSVEVQSGFNPTKASPASNFNGGVLIFNNNGQTWGLTGSSGGKNPSALTIDTNTTVEFFHDNGGSVAQNGAAFGASNTINRNVTNNGYLYSAQGNAWASINGNGVNVFQFDGGNNGSLNQFGNATYSGQLFDFNSGLFLNAYTNFEPGTPLESTDITTFGTSGPQYLGQISSLKNVPVWRLDNDVYMSALDWQIGGRGILQFGGIMLPPGFNKSKLALADIDVADLAQYSYGSGVNVGFGKTIYQKNQANLVFGAGQAIVANPLDPTGVTNNVFIQGNPANSLLSVDQFAQVVGPQAEALGLDYSGQYRVNFNLNARISTNANGSFVITSPYSGFAPYNLVILDPNDPLFNPAGGASAANHPVFTVPSLFAGLTRIDTNAILQLGDGTTGNDIIKTIAPAGLAPDGTAYTPITGHYNDSNGNGALITKGNYTALLPTVGTVNAMSPAILASLQIVNNGQIIVDNTVGARDAVSTGTNPGASAGVAAFVAMNELDNISGTGSLLQMGNLTLTLEGSTTYSGATDVAAGSVLALQSNAATGTTGLPNSTLNLRGALATFDVSQADPTIQIAGLTGAAGSVIALGANSLTANIATPSLFAGSITDGGIAGGAGGAFTKAGAATLTLSGSSTYTGATLIAAGTLQNGQTDALPTATALTIAPGAAYDLASFNQTIGALTSTGTVTNSGATLSTLTIGAGDQSSTFAGILQDGASPLGLTKMGAGTLTLSGTNTYSGATTINAGTLMLGSTGALPLASAVAIAAGATLDLGGFSRTIPAFTGAGFVSYGGTSAATLTTGSDNASTTFTGSILNGAAPLGLVKTGTGTLTLNGVNPYTGPTDVQAGTLAVGDLANPGASIGGSAKVEAGAALKGHGTIYGDLTNLGTVEPGGSVGTLTVAGNYTQGNGANLLVAVTPSAASLLNVAGTASLAGTATFVFAPGTYVDQTYTIVAAAGGVTGTFAGTQYQGATPTPLNPRVAYTPNAAQLVLGAGTTPPATTPPATTPPVVAPPVTMLPVVTPPVVTPPMVTPPVTTPVVTSPVTTPVVTPLADTPSVTTPPVTTPVLPPIVTPPTTTPPVTPVVDPTVAPPAAIVAVVRPVDEQLASETLAVQVLATDRATQTLLGRAGTAIDPTACVTQQARPRSAVPNAPVDITDTLGSAFCLSGGWIEATGTDSHVDGNGGVAGFRGGSAGLVGGIDQAIGAYGLRLGIALGDDETWLNDGSGGSARLNTVRGGFYAIQPVGRVQLNAAILYAHETLTSQRATGLGQAGSHTQGNIISGGVQASLPLTLADLSIVPALGVRIADVDQRGFAETGVAQGFGVIGARARALGTSPYGRITVAKSLSLAGGATLTPTVQAGYAYQAADAGTAVSLTAQDGTTFASRHVALARGTPTAAASLTYERANIAVFATYSAFVGSNVLTQTGSAGMRLAF